MPLEGSIKVIGGAVLLMSGILAVTLGPSPQSKAYSESQETRTPASVFSIVGQSSGTRELIERTMVLTFPCHSHSVQTVSPQIRQVQVQSPGCQLLRGMTVKEVINTSNGITAQLFSDGRQGFTSDYIHLSDGDNRIVVTYEGSDGEQQTQELTIKR